MFKAATVQVEKEDSSQFYSTNEIIISLLYDKYFDGYLGTLLSALLSPKR